MHDANIVVPVVSKYPPRVRRSMECRADLQSYTVGLLSRMSPQMNTSSLTETRLCGWWEMFLGNTYS